VNTRLFGLLSALLILTQLPAQEDFTFTARLDGTSQHYVELLPPNFRPDEPTDLLIALHGHGSDRWQFIKDTRGECKGLRDVAAKYGAIVVSPDYRAKTSWMGPAAEADLLQILDEVQSRRKIRRTFVAGGSMGGTSAAIFAVLHPERVQGFCSLNGTANMLEYKRFTEAISASYGGTVSTARAQYEARSPELHPERLTMPAAFTTGGQDTIVPPDSTLKLVSALQAARRPVYHIHRPDGGHSTTLADTTAAVEFLFTPNRPPPIPESSSKPNPQPAQPAPKQPIPESLRSRFNSLNADTTGKLSLLTDSQADAVIFKKAVDWALSYEPSLTPTDAELLDGYLSRYSQRLTESKKGAAPWASRKGKTARGFQSLVDGSVQPYGIIIPAGYDGTTAFRLDVVLHGSSKPVGMSEARFIKRFEEGDGDGVGPNVPFIELHPLGRVENCYRWAGETDVFEAIEAVCRNYKIDRRRIVLRGMSMGASGTWHLGLKHPSQFAALGPYCGYVDTHRFSETPVPGFIKVGPLPEHQERGLRMLDSIGFAANASMVPVTAAIGDQDVFFQSHVHMSDVFKSEGLEMVNLIAKGTGHTIEPATHKAQLERIANDLNLPNREDPETLRFVTWTLKYANCRWLEVLGLGQHYQRSEFIAKRTNNALTITKADNITRFRITHPLASVQIEGATVQLSNSSPTRDFIFSKRNGVWSQDEAASDRLAFRKKPRLQGPIDDAFSAPFVCVRGTGTPWHADVQAWADASLQRFQNEWRRFMRGELPIKNDSEITETDIKKYHLILFGDPGSNRWISKTLGELPIEWTANHLRMADRQFASKDHVPVFIHPNPLSPDRYIVVNSGHTFHEAEFAAFNYLLFPRLGDRAVMQILPGIREWQPGKTFPENPVLAGFFDESWK
jgi:pimeloyl-ACP methyl ester carboxylesterase